MTAVEAMILKVPTLLSRVSANYEVTKGLCHYYEPADDVEALAAAILAFFKEPENGEALEDKSKEMLKMYDYQKIARSIWNYSGSVCNMNEIKVSIITPLYKGTDYIPGLMAMIRKNAGKEAPKAKLEFILVNDSPADGSLEEEELIRNYVPDQALN